MSAAGLALQAGLYAQLASIAPLMTQLTGLFDHVPEAQALPYLVIGEALASDWSSATFDGRETRLSLHLWTRAAGRKQAKELSGLIQAALQPGLPPLNGHKLTMLSFLSERTLIDADGVSQHTILEYRARTRPA
jgi:hypothetical protein